MLFVVHLDRLVVAGEADGRRIDFADVAANLVALPLAGPWYEPDHAHYFSKGPTRR